MLQSPYSHPMEPIINVLSPTSQETTEKRKEPPFLTSFIASNQRVTLGVLPEEVLRQAAATLRDYVDKSILANMEPAWSWRALERAIVKGPHASSCTPKAMKNICGEMRKCVWDCFRILLPVVGEVRMLRYKLKLSLIDVVPQDHQRPGLILNLLTKPNEGKSSVNTTTGRDVTPESMQFGRDLPHILQKIW